MIAPFFGLWHSVPFIRTMRRGLVRFWWKNNYLLLIALYSPFAQYRQSQTFWTAGMFDHDPSIKFEIIMGEVNQNCKYVCESNQKTCLEKKLSSINSCYTMKLHFACTDCEGSNGQDQPAVDTRGICLVNSGIFSCSGQYPSTRRFCPCA